MNRQSWVYICGIYAVALILAIQAALTVGHTHPDWLVVELLLALAIGAQLFKFVAPNHVLFYATPIFFFAGTILLDPLLLLSLIVASHLAEWVKERWLGSEYLRAWYLQPFNIAMFWIAGRGAQGVFALLHDRIAVGTAGELIVVLCGAVVYVALNHSLLGFALVLARGVSWAESGIMDTSSLVSDFVLLCVGSTVAELWLSRPWFALPALAPIALMYRALMVPKLKEQAETDGKTGLFNARHFATLFAAELDRAQRFDRPLTVIMADLDHLRDINNTYGHLAGDAVLVGVANVIHATIRDYDVAARFGGEEFALLLPELDEDGARILAERLRRAVEAAGFAAPNSAAPLRATMSVGVACFPHDGRTTAELLQAADTAVYAAKETGRNRAVCASDVATSECNSSSRHKVHLSMETDPPEPVDPARLRPTMVKPPEANARIRTWIQGTFVAAIILAGMATVVAGALGSSGVSPLTIGILALFGASAELLQVDVFGQGTVSVSVGVAFTAALLTGIDGVVVVSGAIALVHHVHQRRGANQLYRAVFNWSVHILAGLVVVAGLEILAVRSEPLMVTNFGLLIPTALLAAAGYFVVETGLIAIVIGLSRGEAFLPVWRSNFRWLLPHYAVLCFTGLAISVTFTELGALGVFIFGLPLVMMHYVQRQHVLQTRDNVLALQRMNRDLVRAALHDHITGLGNERAFQEALRREIHASAERGVSLVLARLDLDEFKAINEEVGRPHGDQMLVEVADMLAAAPALHFAFRLSADDFAVILPNASLVEAVPLLDRFCSQVPEHVGGATLSIGVAALAVGDLDADLLNDQSLRALSEAKRRARNIVVSFDEIRDNAQLASWAQERSVRRILTKMQIDVAFQPIWDIDTCSILGYEALARPPAEFGLVGPQEAFDVASRIGRARDLDAVCRAAILARAHELPSSARLFMNVAPESLEHDGLSGEELAEAVIQAGLRPERVVLELTERSIVRTETVVRQAQHLRQFGFSFALDDTGAGNAGLGVLSQLNVDFVKIDRSIVNHAGTDQAARAVLAGIFALANEMGAFVIAEGIETEDMLQLVREMSQAVVGSRSQMGRGVQGFLFGAPSLELAGAGSEEPSVTLLAAARLGRGRHSANVLDEILAGARTRVR